jgi:hypothetical protein
VQRRFLREFLKESSHFKEEKYEIAKIFEGFVQISNFLLLFEIAKIFGGFGQISNFLLLLKLSYLAIFSHI